jgi:acyl-CoA synthetase (AMP-forming)/AMP-acid ligase II
VPLTHRNLVTNLRNISRHYKLTPEDRSLIVMPLFHVHGLIGYSFTSHRRVDHASRLTLHATFALTYAHAHAHAPL